MLNLTHTTYEKAQLADYLRQTTGLELSEEKTRISDLSEGFEFLGHRVRHKWHPRFGLMPRVEIPKRRRADVRLLFYSGNRCLFGRGYEFRRRIDVRRSVELAGSEQSADGSIGHRRKNQRIRLCRWRYMVKQLTKRATTA